jgi:hypothetical protein
LILLALAAPKPAPQEIRAERMTLYLSSLRAGCLLEKRWIGFVMSHPWGAWIQCGGEPVLLESPRGLLGKVAITSKDRALEFLRFFSSSDSYDMFSQDGMCEVSADSNSEAWEATIREHLGRRFERPSITENVAQSLCHEADGSALPCSMRQYHVSRVVVMYDQSVYRVQETVWQDGCYVLEARHRLLRDVRRFGVFHLGPY